MNGVMTADQVPVKISALRTYYCKELRKETLSRKSGAGRDDIYESTTWEWFKLLDPFLRSQVHQKKTLSNLETNTLSTEQDGPSQVEQVAQEEENVEPDNVQAETMDCTPPPPSKRKRQDSVPLQVLAILKSIENRRSQSENNGELCFAKYLASEIARVSNLSKRNELKIKVQQLIFEYQNEE
ncbi:uncharacterized protein LOC124253872 [Haliotis rubra]|uniref:uncharacterized protein LOC124253872 n=1 Tax=Haliotis rubra TaxID=36100 RepID=UPI001EE5AB98|nr:uncharacterized protein LOC124253872 [Haliotis rubra]